MTASLLWFATPDADAPRDAREYRFRAAGALAAPRQSDETLLVQLQSADTTAAIIAFEELFRTWFAPLVAFGRSLISDAAAAEDIVQSIFVDAWERRETVRVSTSIAAYLHGAVRHRALTWRRNLSRRARLLGSIAAAEFPGIPCSASSITDPNGVDAETDDEERFRAVVSAADTLPPRAREVFYLRWRQGMSHREIAEVMEISVKTVEAQMTIALRRVREMVRGV
jgi:RNA polymerase sigma-70 factor (ECF subfamily)